MALLDRLKVVDTPAKPHVATSPAAVISIRAQAPQSAAWDESYQEVKSRIHYRLIERLDLSKLASMKEEELLQQVRQVVLALLQENPEITAKFNRDKLIEEILHETFGLGPLEPLLQDGTISDILVNSHMQVYVERFGKLELTRTRFKDDAHLLHIIDRIVSKVGRRVDESSPMVDARLPDGSRVNAIIPPLAIDGPTLSIRKFGAHKVKMDDLVRFGTLLPEHVRVLQGAVQARLNIIIGGGTGSGKTTLLNALSSHISTKERIITIEDAAELQLQQDHVVRLETRPPNMEAAGTITQRDLLRNALRMRPDRIVIGEVRGAEALDMLQAMNTGHDGSMTTLHANTPRGALRRLETMILMAGANLPDRAMREQISSAVDVLVHASRLSDGSRKVMCIAEIVGMETDVITMQEIFVFEKMGIRPDGKVIGRFRATGIRPKFIARLKAAGINLPDYIFDPEYYQRMKVDE